MALQLPSASNTAGTALGSIVGTVVIASGPSWPFIISAAAALSTTPVGMASIVAVVATILVNYAVTHYAQVKDLDGLVQAYWPQIQAKYPNDPNPNPSIQAWKNKGK